MFCAWVFVCLGVRAAIGICECFSLCLKFVRVIARNLSVIAAIVLSIAMASLDLLCVTLVRMYVRVCQIPYISPYISMEQPPINDRS